MAASPVFGDLDFAFAVACDVSGLFSSYTLATNPTSSSGSVLQRSNLSTPVYSPSRHILLSNAQLGYLLDVALSLRDAYERKKGAWRGFILGRTRSPNPAVPVPS